MKSGREKILEIIFLYAAAMSVRHRNCVERALSCLICYVERHARGVGAAWEVCESGLGEDSEVHRGVGGALTPLSCVGAARERGPRYMPASVRGCCMVGAWDRVNCVRAPAASSCVAAAWELLQAASECRHWQCCMKGLGSR